MRMHAPVVAAIARAAGEAVELASPGPGLFRVAVRPGDVVRPGSVLGHLEVLGRLVAVTVPEGARGVVTVACGHGAVARPAVDHGAALVELDPRAGAGAVEAGEGAVAGAGGAAGAGAAAHERVYRAPTSGRFYGRPSPDKPPFVEPGAELVPGATICLLEVMKTFHRVTYAGDPVRVREVLVADGEDVNAGDALLALE